MCGEENTSRPANVRAVRHGRTARALFYWAMAKSGYWLVEFISISHFLRQAPGQYVRAYLHTETDDNDATYFAIHQLTTMRKAIDAVHAYLTRKSEEQHQTERLMARSSALRARLNHRQITLLTHALRHPGGDHVMFIGEVERCEHHADRAPLLYHSGHMHAHGFVR